jgi:hypothetical protein
MHEPSIGKGFFNNKYAFYAVGVLVIFPAHFTYAPFMNEWFGTAHRTPPGTGCIRLPEDFSSFCLLNWKNIFLAGAG